MAWDSSKFPAGTSDEIAFALARYSQASTQEDEEVILEGMLSFLFGLGSAFAPSCAQMSSTHGRLQAYHIATLIQCLVLAGYLRDTGQMKRVVMKALSIALPHHIAQTLRVTYLDAMKLPDRSLLSRFRVVLDCGFMMYMRDVNWEYLQCPAESVLHCMLSDSSPQGLENWQITEVYTILDPKYVADLVDSIINLQAVLEAAQATEDIDHIQAQVADKTSDLIDHSRHHILPPTALGLRRASLPHKANCVLHSAYNEHHNLKSLRNFLRSVCCFTSDLGVEKDIWGSPQHRLASDAQAIYMRWIQ